MRIVSLLAPVVLGGLVFLLRPAGEIARAEGCSGSGSGQPTTCWLLKEGDLSWDMSNQDVPTNAPLRFALAKDVTGCAYPDGIDTSEGGPLTIEVRDSGGTLVPGGPSTVTHGTGVVFSSEQVSFSWGPSQAWLPSSTYTLRLIRADGSSTLTFTTAAGPYVLPAPAAPKVTTSTQVVSVKMISCMSNGWTGNCQGNHVFRSLLDGVRPVLSLAPGDLLPVHDSLRSSIRVRVEKSEAGQPYSLYLENNGLPKSGQLQGVSFAGTEGPFCVRVQYENTLNQESVTSPPTCVEASSFEFVADTPHCENVPQGSGGECSGISNSEAAQFLATHCGAAGSGAAGAGEAGSGANVSGSSGQTGGSTPPDSGCQMGSAPGSGLAGLGLLAALGAVGRRRARREG